MNKVHMCLNMLASTKEPEKEAGPGNVYQECGRGVSRMAQWVTVISTKSNDLSSILGPYMVEGEKILPKTVL